MVELTRRGLLFVLSSPSGAGKSTLAQQLLRDDGNLELSVSVTTRKRRTSEIDGHHYHFIDEAHFHQMAERQDLLEWAEVHGNFYGTPREAVETALSKGRDVLFDIDYQGTRQIAEKMSADLVRIFILPPSFGELKARLERRAEDSSGTIERRLENAKHEIREWESYDYVIVNDDLGRSYAKVKAILEAERNRRERVTGLPAFVTELLDEAAELTKGTGSEAASAGTAQK
ncbi:guanylate kinase [Faunimonas pinastri]|uniref:Guanylate kinase n=2 Tax=Faunimonas pinastri TaxID=1855383 RepID=A0A1H9DCF1_9HYPH|nr:guanylate kinase [Faunimonas pinastri]